MLMFIRTHIITHVQVFMVSKYACIHDSDSLPYSSVFCELRVTEIMFSNVLLADDKALLQHLRHSHCNHAQNRIEKCKYIM